MTVSLKHTFTSPKIDGTDTSLVQPSNWNAEHTLTAAAGVVLGRDTSGAGAVQELPIAVTSGGNVSITGTLGIGIVAPSGLLQLNKTSGTVDIRLSVGGTLYGTVYATATDFNVFSNAATPLIFGTNTVERLRVGPLGQLGIGGANYGTSGQVLTSAGSGAAPTWSTPASPIAVGTISYFPNTSGSSAQVPDSTWLPCGGTIVSQSTYPALYAAVGLRSNIQLNTAWTTRTSANGATTAAAYGNGIFVVVGSNVIQTSPTGTTWTARTPAAATACTAIVYANNLFVAVGGTAVQTSPDGITWTSRTSNATGTLRAIAYGNSTFIAVGDSNTVITSSDGVTWTARNTTGIGGYGGIAYGNGLFAITNDTGTATRAYTSANGVSWALSSTISFPSNNFSGVSRTPLAYGDGNFNLGLTDEVNNIVYIYTSSDTINWYNTVYYNNFVVPNISYLNGTFISLIRDTTTLLPSAAFSYDGGISWTYNYNNGSSYLGYCVATDGTTIVSPTVSVIYTHAATSYNTATSFALPTETAPYIGFGPRTIAYTAPLFPGCIPYIKALP